MREEMVSTGFQSSLRMLRQTLPSRSMLGWYTCRGGREEGIPSGHLFSGLHAKHQLFYSGIIAGRSSHSPLLGT